MNEQRKIDIIIPIYNAYEDLKKCVESVLKYTDLTSHRLLLINDVSPDLRISVYLKKINRPNIIILENEQNLGFSGSINKGIKTSENRDVILLNSDTIVTRNWVEKIISCAYSDAAIATVTPLSNNATLCSVPAFLKENKLPDNYTLDEYADLIENISLKKYPRIPVANGFCIYIKREVIEKIGMFDSATFGRGYGEENDFCYRAEQVGYYHVMCDNTYIYHTGTSSFISKEKQKYIEEHERILNDRYPEQNHAVAVYCRDNPNKWVQENIKLWTDIKNGKKNILFLVQSDFRKDAHDHLGGTQLHVKDMTMIMRKTYNVFVIARNIEYLNLTVYTDRTEHSFKYYIGNASRYAVFHDKRFSELYGAILDVFRIDLVHIHHTKNLSLELYYEAYKRNIPILTTLHDFFSVCPCIKLMDCHGSLCIKKNSDCGECVKKLYGIQENIKYISIWREEYFKVLNMSKKIIVPSQSTKEILLQFYPDLKNRFQVVEHGMEIMKRKNNGRTDELHVAILGGPDKEKGSEIAYQLINNSPKDIHWYAFGIWGYNNLSLLNKNNYTKIGLYERDEFPSLVEKYKINIACILSIWPETYCYTLSEAIMCGIPVIATDIGALGERMRKLKCGWLVRPNRAYEDTMNIIKEVYKDKKIYLEKQKEIEQIHVKSLDEMRKEYQNIYIKLFVSEGTVNLHGSKEMNTVLLGYSQLNNTFGDNQEQLKIQIEALTKDYTEMKSSFQYKCAGALTKIPMAQSILTFVYSVYLKMCGIKRFIRQKILM